MNQKILLTTYSKLEYQKHMKLYPEMSRQQIVTRVLLDWKNVSQQKKKELYNDYLQRGLIKQFNQQKSKYQNSNSIRSSERNQRKISRKYNIRYKDKPYQQQSSSSSNLSHSLNTSSISISQQYQSLPTLHQNRNEEQQEKIKTDQDIRQKQMNLSSYQSFGLNESQISIKMKNQQNHVKPKMQQNPIQIKKIQYTIQSQIIQANEQRIKQQKQKNQVQSSQLSSSIKPIKQPQPLEEAHKLNETKANMSLKTSQYLRFYLYYYKKLHKLYPNLQSVELTIIIKTLWKQKKQKQRQLLGSNKNSRKKNGSKSKLSGKQLFFKQKIREGYIKRQIKQMWVRLPFESKQQWRKNSNDPNFQISLIKKNKSMLTPSQIVQIELQNKQQNEKENPLTFLNKSIECKIII